MNRRTRHVSVVIVLAMTLYACGSGGRPEVAEWRPIWDELTQGIPSSAEFEDPADRSLCGSALGLVRSAEADLFPTPDRAIEPAVREWVRIAEDAFFECPPSSNEIPSFEFAYRELARLEAEVDAALLIDGP